MTHTRFLAVVEIDFNLWPRLGTCKILWLWSMSWYGLLGLYNFRFSSLATESDVIIIILKGAVLPTLYDIHLRKLWFIWMAQSPIFNRFYHENPSSVVTSEHPFNVFCSPFYLPSTFGKRFCLQLRCARYNFIGFLYNMLENLTKQIFSLSSQCCVLLITQHIYLKSSDTPLNNKKASHVHC